MIWLKVPVGNQPNLILKPVLLTHAHADRADYVLFLHEKIPVCMGTVNRNPIKATQERPPSDFERQADDSHLGA